MTLTLAQSLQGSGLTPERWRAQAARRWAEVKASAHYHAGVPCKLEPTCREYDPEAATAAEEAA